MLKLQLSMAKVAHKRWQFRMRSYLDGVEDLSVSDITSHTECDFGKWYQEKGKAQISGKGNTQYLEDAHAELHRTARQIYDLKNAGDSTGAEAAFERLKELSTTISDILDDIAAAA